MFVQIVPKFLKVNIKEMIRWYPPLSQRLSNLKDLNL